MGTGRCSRDLARGPSATVSAGYEGAIAALLMILAAVCLVCLALVLLKRRMLDGEDAPASTTGSQNQGANDAVSGLSSTAIRLTVGAISVGALSHLLPMLDSKLVKSVSLPPGRARLGTKPRSAGSVTYTTGSAACGSQAEARPPRGVVTARLRSGARRTSRSVWARRRLASGTKQ